MHKKSLAALLCALISVCILCGCTGGAKLDPKNPLTITLWHNYGGQMQKPWMSWLMNSTWARGGSRASW